MKFWSGISGAHEPDVLVGELSDGAVDQLGAPVDLAVLFFTAPLTDVAAELGRVLRDRLRPRVFLGVSCESIAGGDQELESGPGASILVASLPGVELRPFHIAASAWRELLADGELLQQRIGSGERHQGQLVLGDPFTTPIEDLLKGLDETFHRPTFGGMASGARSPQGNLLLLDGAAHRDGAIGVGIGGDVDISYVVSQGCRPIGEPMVVTRAEQNLILELGRRPAWEVVRETLERLPDDERSLLHKGLFVGIVINEYQAGFQRGDFLVRGVLGADPDSGAVAVGDVVRPGQTVQLQLRDAASAHEDLVELLKPQAELSAPAGALLFSCNGRGTRMFRQAHHDVRTTLEQLPGVPLAGFFAMGELGPIGGRTFIHGHTASLALFRPARERHGGPIAPTEAAGDDPLVPPQP